MQMKRGTSSSRAIALVEDSGPPLSISASTCCCSASAAAVRERHSTRHALVARAVGHPQLFPAAVAAAEPPVIKNAPRLITAIEVQGLGPPRRAVAADPLDRDFSRTPRGDVSGKLELMRTAAIPVTSVVGRHHKTFHERRSDEWRGDEKQGGSEQRSRHQRASSKEVPR